MNKMNLREIASNLYRYTEKVNMYYKNSITEIMTRHAKAMGLNGNLRFSHFFILCELYHCNEPMYLTTLSEIIGVKLPNISKLANELIEYGLIERVYSSDNKRLFLVQMTDLGQQYSDKIIPDITSLGEKTFLRLENIEQICNQYKAIYDDISKEDL